VCLVYTNRKQIETIGRDIMEKNMCKYEGGYHDYEMDKSCSFKCNEKPLKDGFCIFHHPEIWKENPEEVAKKFYNRVESAIKSNEKLLCIGYNLPDIVMNKELPIPAYFDYSNFHGKTDFSSSRFKEASFNRVKFSKLANFSKTTSSNINFFDAKFNDVALFDKATFKKVTFMDVCFNEVVVFSHVKFDDKANFSFAEFNDQAVFLQTKFKEASFVGSEFKEAVFGSEFDEAHFIRARFKKIGDFSFSIFNGKADFSDAIFEGEAEFSNVIFNEFGRFLGVTFKGKANFIGLRRVKGNSLRKDPILTLTDIRCSNPEEICFDDFDLSNTSFAYADAINKFDIRERVLWEANRKLLDERLADKEVSYEVIVPAFRWYTENRPPELPYEVAATVYRRLRQNLESKFRYTEAGRFFIAEMEVKRKNVRVKNRAMKWLRTNLFSALAWYKYFSNYGESYQRTILWIACIPLLAAFLTALTQTLLLSPTQLITNFQNYLRDYAFAFFQLKTDNTIELTIRILSLLLLGQLYISLRRQFERRYKI